MILYSRQDVPGFRHSLESLNLLLSAKLKEVEWPRFIEWLP